MIKDLIPKQSQKKDRHDDPAALALTLKLPIQQKQTRLLLMPGQQEGLRVIGAQAR